MTDYEKKDLILKQFVEELHAGVLFKIEIQPLCDLTGFDKYRIDAILSDMQEHGLIEYHGRNSSNTTHVALKERIYEFSELGGYTAKFKILEQEMKRLELEVKQLQKVLTVEDASNITNIVSSISGLLGNILV